jgi:hypothetical protein
MRELFAALPDEPAPPPPPGYLDTVLVLGRRSIRRRRIGAAGAWAAVIVALAILVVPGVKLPIRPVAPSQKPGLPDRFAGYSMLTSTVTKAPPGRAIALYSYGNGEMLNMFQSLVVGADHDTYRQVDAMQERGRPSALLAPDGTRVLLGDDRGATADLVLVDLGTGTRKSVPIGSPVAVRLLAWSPDQRFVAYSIAPPAAIENTVNAVDDAVNRTGILRLLDLTTGQSIEMPSLAPASTAAFAPDSDRLAVQVGREAHLIDLNGQETGRVHIPIGQELAANVGWTPDGAFLATMSWPDDGASNGTPGLLIPHGVFLPAFAGAIDFVALAADGAQPPARVPDVVQLLGWRSSSSMVVATADSEEHVSLAEVSLDSGTRQTLSQFDTGSSCELGMHPCEVFDLRLATGLLPDLSVRSAGHPQRGPWPTTLTISLSIVIAGAALLVWLRVRKT